MNEILQPFLSEAAVRLNAAEAPLLCLPTIPTRELARLVLALAEQAGIPVLHDRAAPDGVGEHPLVIPASWCGPAPSPLARALLAACDCALYVPAEDTAESGCCLSEETQTLLAGKAIVVAPAEAGLIAPDRVVMPCSLEAAIMGLLPRVRVRWRKRWQSRVARLVAATEHSGGG